MNAHIEGAVKRPSRMAGRVTGGGSTRSFYYDGSTVTLHDSGPNHYAVVDGARTLDRTIDQIAAQYNFTPPLADLLVSNPGGSLGRNATSGTLKAHRT